MMMGRGTPIDWTNGTGVFPAGGVITVPANPYRQSIFVQNQDTAAAAIVFSCIKGSDGSACTTLLQLGASPTTAGQGGADQLGLIGLMATGGFTVNGTAGKAVLVVTN